MKNISLHVPLLSLAKRRGGRGKVRSRKAREHNILVKFGHYQELKLQATKLTTTTAATKTTRLNYECANGPRCQWRAVLKLLPSKRNERGEMKVHYDYY